MKISVDLLPPINAHCISYERVEWAFICSGIPVICDKRFLVNTHINLYPKESQDFIRSYWPPGLLVGRVAESNVLRPKSERVGSGPLRIEVCTFHNKIDDCRGKEKSK